MSVWQIIHCGFDLLAAFIVIGLALETTPGAALRPNHPQRQWAMMRRLAYGMMSICLFARAMMILDPRMATQEWEALTGVGIVLPVLFFLVMRASGAVKQDEYVGFHWRNRRTR